MKIAYLSLLQNPPTTVMFLEMQQRALLDGGGSFNEMKGNSTTKSDHYFLQFRKVS